MKQILFLLAIILWSIMQARRKAVREQKRKQALGERTPTTTPARALGAVTSEENRAAYASAQAQDQFFQDAERDVPEQIKPIIEQARRSKKKKRDEDMMATQPASDETVERIVKDVPSIGMQNYEKLDKIQKRFVLNQDSIRNYVVTREVLGPPRSRKPFRPAMKDRE